MINFFRRIRKKMADDNRPLKYMRYAIGEIVLVVIGILIALQINTWNEERKERIEEKNLLLELRTEFRHSKSGLESYGRECSGYIHSINIYYKYATASISEYDPDTLRFLVNSLTRMGDFVSTNQTLNSIESSGKISLIKNAELRNYFKIWENSLIGLNRFMEEREALRSRNILPVVSEYFLFKDDYYSDGSRAIEIIDTTSNDKGLSHFFTAPSNQNLVGTYLNMLQASFYTSGWLLSVTNEVLQMIDEELMKYEDLKVESYFSEIRMSGDAVDNELSFVILKKMSNGTWEGTVPLKDGGVVFSNRAAGIVSWTGDEFPKGKLKGTDFWGNHISVKKGVYRVIFDYENGTYEFIKQDD